MTSLLSVIIPTYNGERYIGAALESVRAQKTDDVELIVVDDGSTDRTLGIVDSFAQDLSISVFKPGRIGNWVAVSNIGLRQAKARWACFLHQDDLWLPGRLARVLHEMATAKGALILHSSLFMSSKGRSLGPWTCPFEDGDVPSELFIERLLIQNFIGMPAPVFRRAAVLDSGGLDEKLWFTADWDLWLRLGAMGPVRFIAEYLSGFRIHPESQTLARGLAEDEWRQQLKVVLDRHLPTWASANGAKKSVFRAAHASVAVNSMLAALSRHDSLPLRDFFCATVRLGPLGLRRYIRDSRILERITSRLRMRWQER